ncbi:glycosyltransferase [Opitutus terrae]|uniref:Glycosyl transferase family 2 n=1 Tax=Opitutus terrae (strain DSM 11246 / JCM 15787 / PB90-1) TaxID=452637 RepID=B1ZZR4_OPITP|nr:glycosyltransferase [Opitutus terrae]ACB77250.1 glycosyl transferase family 2 [Opitutus terrae PB90-1]
MSIAAESLPAVALAPLQTVFCPICGSDRVHYAFSIRHVRVLQCADCKFTARTEPTTQLLDATGAAAADRLAGTSGELHALVHQLLPEKNRSTRLRIADWRPDGSVTLVGKDTPAPEAEAAPPVVVSIGQLDAFQDPLPSLRALRARVGATQPVVFFYSDIHQDGVEVGSTEWERLASQRNAYIDTSTALTVLYRAGYRCLGVRRLRRRVSWQHFVAHPHDHTFVGRWRRRLLLLIPAAVRNRLPATAKTAETAILAAPRVRETPLVSVVVPVFNEAPTVAKVLDSVLRVQLAGAAVEIVIVESNSTDGSREIVQRYAQHPRVTCIFEERPQGKGHATRLGLAKAQGDVLLIQDADLEYDIEDYLSLLNPIIRGHEAFVLGSRHGGRQHWKLRQFNKPFLAAFYNLAHVLVTGYINLLFGLNLRDPQTMFKVCRRDCVEGLVFHGNYFNFDYELLLKVVRKGYAPIEVPVNYRSRSHAEGKKIRMWRDAPLGLWMITKLRLTPLRRFLTIGEPIE